MWGEFQQLILSIGQEVEEDEEDEEVEYVVDEQEEARIREAELAKLEKDKQAMLADQTLIQVGHRSCRFSSIA